MEYPLGVSGSNEGCHRVFFDCEVCVMKVMKKVKFTLLVIAMVTWGGFSPDRALALQPGDTPWIGWGESSYANTQSGTESGFKFDGYFKQGYVVRNLGDSWSLIPYAAIGVKAADASDEPWNNRAEPWIGIEARNLLDLGDGKWGDVAIGVRTGRRIYFGDGNDESVVSVYVNVSFGGQRW